MEVDCNSSEGLPRDECLRLLGTESRGRLGTHSGALPVILPVAYSVDADAVVARAEGGCRLYGVASEDVVAFEVDTAPGEDGDGWTVLVVGVASSVDPERVVRISTEIVSGRRLRTAA